MTTTIPFTKKPFASSILLWIRTDQPRQQGMDYWKGPHSKIISPTPGFDEYRQIHIAETNPGLWPAPPASRPPSPQTGGSTGLPRSPSPPCSHRCWAGSRPVWRTKTRSTCSGAPCSTLGRRTRHVGTTSPNPARRPGLGP